MNGSPITKKKKVVEAAISEWELKKAKGDAVEASLDKINLILRG